MDDVQADQIISNAPEGWRVLAVAVPTRAFRIVADDANLKFRVEQLDSSRYKQGIFDWRTVSTHIGDFTFESYPPAIRDMLTKQVRLKEMIKLDAHNQKMAMIAVQEVVN